MVSPSTESRARMSARSFAPFSDPHGHVAEGPRHRSRQEFLHRVRTDYRVVDVHVDRRVLMEGPVASFLEVRPRGLDEASALEVGVELPEIARRDEDVDVSRLKAGIEGPHGPPP